MDTNNRYLIFDESGNLGSSGRYFVISCIDTQSLKPLHNIMRKKLGVAKQTFPKLATLHSNEIKAKDAYPCVKYHILECITKKDISISYIVADLKHVKPHLLEDKNIFYNYLMKILLDRIITSKDNGRTINIISDNHTTKVASANSLSDYLTLHFLYDKGYQIKLNISFLDSDSSNAFVIQASDYVANAIYGKYEYGDSLYYDIMRRKVRLLSLFPYELFGQ